MAINMANIQNIASISGKQHSFGYNVSLLTTQSCHMLGYC